MKRLSILLASSLVLLFAATACDSDDGGSSFTGMYKLTSYQESAACDGSGEWTDKDTDITYFQYKKDDFLGVALLGFHDCTGETEDTCSDTINLDNTYTYATGDKLMASTPMAMGSGGTCMTSINDMVMELTETGIKWTITKYSGEMTAPEGVDCFDIDDAKVLETKGDMACESTEKYEADKL